MKEAELTKVYTSGYKGHFVAWRHVAGLAPNAKKGPLYCALCQKDITRLGDKRFKVHIKNHEKSKS